METGAAIRARQGRHSVDRGQARSRAGADPGGVAITARPDKTRGARRLSGSAAGAIVTAFAPAKINLYLHVVGWRSDGYHLLDSLVAFADIGDEITAAPADSLSFAVGGPEAAGLAGLGDNNLVLRAAREFAALHEITSRAALCLDKQLPIASGIGGGSSDAAATLRALAQLWDRPLDRAVTELAASLGADVPACLVGQPVWVGGVGERLEALPSLPSLGIVLANPRRELPTAAVFRARQGDFTAREQPRIRPRDAAALIELLKECGNDLTEAALSLLPDIATVLAGLAALPGAYLARMSGSGATCFALFAERATAERAAVALTRAEPRWWVKAGALLAGPPPLRIVAPPNRVLHRS
jgi:4-diphosphocytidyl-2-C-methyl-D-erythritol kinase